MEEGPELGTRASKGSSAGGSRRTQPCRPIPGSVPQTCQGLHLL